MRLEICLATSVIGIRLSARPADGSNGAKVAIIVLLMICALSVCQQSYVGVGIRPNIVSIIAAQYLLYCYFGQCQEFGST